MGATFPQMDPVFFYEETDDQPMDSGGKSKDCKAPREFQFPVASFWVARCCKMLEADHTIGNTPIPSHYIGLVDR